MECMAEKRCQSVHDKSHSSVLMEKSTDSQFVDSVWTSSTSVAKIVCFPKHYQEPQQSWNRVSHRYLLVRNSYFLPLYDERFIGHSYSQLGYVEKLRYNIEQFFVITHAFVVVIPPSMYFFLSFLIFRSLQTEKLKGSVTDPDSLEMYTLLTKVLNELNQTVSKSSLYVPTCPINGQSLYHCLF